jgi:hypothetical protein
MEPEGSLLGSEEPTTDPNPEPDEFSVYVFNSCFFKVYF